MVDRSAIGRKLARDQTIGKDDRSQWSLNTWGFLLTSSFTSRPNMFVVPVPAADRKSRYVKIGASKGAFCKEVAHLQWTFGSISR
ncbi:predicted protein [Plenodomus lingam JN3]|uniref:Predicted protein n=1 Tax=Leptosphaeria maculans (strain JN3 / isolate v23.1.3 / race Av1-4-5-6-7-8) TaxID=985895 RepID=E4ZTT1_LEPMJ|nr:predicted protein [Plenodomus lingam JN3]CBX94641.1 predicted protein [Plenodomus lingam JN3]